MSYDADWCYSVLSALQITRNPFNDLIMILIRRALFLLIYSYCFLHPLVRYLSSLHTFSKKNL